MGMVERPRDLSQSRCAGLFAFSASRPQIYSPLTNISNTGGRARELWKATPNVLPSMLCTGLHHWAL